MRGMIRALLLLSVSAGLHLAALALLPAGHGGGGGDAGTLAPEIRGADADLAALVALWDAPPETGATAALAAPPAAKAADLAAAKAALEAVEAGAATEALDETRDPGPTPDRPVMAALPTPPTSAPAALVPRAPGPSLSLVSVDTGPARSSGPAIGGRDAAPAPGGALSGMTSLGPARTPGLARPAAPPTQESMAPRRSPAPAPRSSAAARMPAPDDAAEPANSGARRDGLPAMPSAPLASPDAGGPEMPGRPAASAGPGTSEAGAGRPPAAAALSGGAASGDAGAADATDEGRSAPDGHAPQKAHGSPAPEGSDGAAARGASALSPALAQADPADTARPGSARAPAESAPPPGAPLRGDEAEGVPPDRADGAVPPATTAAARNDGRQRDGAAGPAGAADRPGPRGMAGDEAPSPSPGGAATRSPDEREAAPARAPQDGADAPARAGADAPARRAARRPGADDPSGAGAPGAEADTGPLARRYGARIRAAIDRRKRYPPAARLRGAEGATLLEIEITRAGALSGAEIARSSGHAALDAAALAAARSVGSYPQAPAALPGGPFVFRVPVAFRLR